nr:glycosyltransferase family 4 protein [uncultured Carboxylicivirga sp.]
MKIVFISTLTAPFGGSEVLWYKTALMAIEKGFQVSIFTYKWDDTPAHINELKKKNATIYYRPYNKLFKSTFLYKVHNKTIKKILNNNIFNKINEINPDVIVVNQGGTYNAIEDKECYNYLSSTSIPFVLTARFNYDYNVLNYNIIEDSRRIFNKAAKIVFASAYNKVSAENQILQNLPNSIVLTSPLNLQSKEIVPFPNLDNKLNIACVARLEVNIKGQAMLIQVLNSEEWRKREWTLNLYGNGPDMKYLKEQVQYFDLQSRIHFHGHVKNIREIYKLNHLLVLPSFHEGNPISLQEAMICGRPSVVTNVGGNAEFIEDNITGFICPAPTSQLLNETMERCWNNRNNLKQMGLMAHSKILQLTPANPESVFFKVIENVHERN